MPVTHGVAGSSPVRTAKSLHKPLWGLFLCIQIPFCIPFGIHSGIHISIRVYINFLNNRILSVCHNTLQSIMTDKFTILFYPWISRLNRQGRAPFLDFKRRLYSRIKPRKRIHPFQSPVIARQAKPYLPATSIGRK